MFVLPQHEQNEPGNQCTNDYCCVILKKILMHWWHIIFLNFKDQFGKVSFSWERNFIKLEGETPAKLEKATVKVLWEEKPHSSAR